MVPQQLLILLALTFGQPDDHRPENLIDLATLRRLVSERAAAVKSIKVRFRIPHKQFKGRSEFPDQLDGFEDQIFTWWRQGRRERLAAEPWTQDKEKVPLPMWFSFDGKSGHQIDYWPHGDGPRDITKMDEVPQPLELMRPRMLPEVTLANTRTTFEQLLRRPEARLDGSDGFYGERWQKVDLGLVEILGGAVNRLFAWYDVEHEGLIRACQYQWESPPDPANPPSYFQKGLLCAIQPVREIQSIRNPLTGQNEWWPRTVHAPAPIDRDLVVFEEILLNHDIPASEFIPDIPAGVNLVELKNGRPIKTFVSGGDAGFFEFQRRSDRGRSDRSGSTAGNVPTIVSAPSARPITRSSLTWWLTIASISLLIAAGIFALRMRAAR